MGGFLFTSKKEAAKNWVIAEKPSAMGIGLVRTSSDVLHLQQGRCTSQYNMRWPHKELGEHKGETP